MIMIPSQSAENSDKLCDETGNPVVNLMEIQWKLRSEFPNGGKAVVEQIPASQEINKSKRARPQESQSEI